jgi:hypothetical protein
VPTIEQVRQLLEQGLDYSEIAYRLGVPPGQAYLIGTGMPADGGDTYSAAERKVSTARSGQHTRHRR